MTRRTDMLATDVRMIVAPVLRECPQECGIVSITDVRISSDSSYADLYISALTEPKKALEFLERRKRELQHKLSELPRRVLPRIRFRLDMDQEKSNRVTDLLTSLEKNGQRTEDNE